MSDQEPLPALCANLARLRSERGLTLREVEKQTGIVISYISALERGRQTNPSLHHMISLAFLYDVSLDDLAGLNEVTP